MTWNLREYGPLAFGKGTSCAPIHPFLGSIRESSGGVLLPFFQTNDGSVENDRNWLYLKDFER